MIVCTAAANIEDILLSFTLLDTKYSYPEHILKIPDPKLQTEQEIEQSRRNSPANSRAISVRCLVLCKDGCWQWLQPSPMWKHIRRSSWGALYFWSWGLSTCADDVDRRARRNCNWCCYAHTRHRINRQVDGEGSPSADADCSPSSSTARTIR
jgi:hypothetical protein